MKFSIGNAFLLILLVVAFGCSSPTMKEKYGYKVLKYEPMKPHKITFYIELKEQLSEAQLTEIAAEYREE